MSESFPLWIGLIGVFAVGLGAARGAMLRSRSFVPRGRRYAEPAALPSPATTSRARRRARRQRPTVASAPGTAQPGLAR